MANENKFPTEVVELPSNGYFYPKDNPLATGKVEMKYMTAREEDILTSENLIKHVKILKSHGNGQSGESFGHCIRCDFVMSTVLHEFEDSPSALGINTL